MYTRFFFKVKTEGRQEACLASFAWITSNLVKSTLNIGAANFKLCMDYIYFVAA